MLVWTPEEIKVNQLFGFVGDGGKTNIEIDDLVYIWTVI